MHKKASKGGIRVVNNTNYVDLVLCKRGGQIQLFQAPKFSLLKPNDEVIYRATGSTVNEILKVSNVISINKDSDEYQFILELVDVYEPRKLYAKADFQKYDWPKGGDAHDQE